MPADVDPPVSVVLCTRDRPHLLATALPAIAAASRPGDEVLVVDSASRDPAQLRRVAGDVPVLRCEQPGASRARNAGWRAATHRVVAFVDDDCQPQPGWSAALGAAFAGDDVGFVTGRVLAVGQQGLPLSLMEGSEPRRWSREVPVREMGHAANLAVRRAALEAVGGFDELLGAGAPLRGAEDKDLFLRLLRTGWSGRYVPDATVTHQQWRSYRQGLAAFYGYGVGDGALTVKEGRLTGASLAAAARTAFGRAVTPLLRDLRSGYQRGVLADAVWALGALRGVAAARRLVVGPDEHFG